MDERVIMSAFTRYVGIDYSGAETPTASLKGLRVYTAEVDTPPAEMPPPPSPRKYWTLLRVVAGDIFSPAGIEVVPLRETAG